MKAMPPRVGCIGLLDRLRVAARAPADYFLLASCRNSQAVSNARIEPPRTQRGIAGISRMKATLFRGRLE